MTEMVLEQTFSSLFPEELNEVKSHGQEAWKKVTFDDDNLAKSFGIQLHIAKLDEELSNKQLSEREAAAHNSDGSFNDRDSDNSAERVRKQINLGQLQRKS